MSELTYTIQQLLKAVVDEKGSDLHISPLSPPRIRVHGIIVPLSVNPLTPADSKNLIYAVLTEKQKKIFEEKLELDIAFSVKGLARFRANVFNQKGCVNATFRLINSEVPRLENLSLPNVVLNATKASRGLFLVCGSTGSGKSTTLAAMINHINENQALHILTIEDPIEYVHDHKKSLVNQREVGTDTYSFANALKSSLREDPDVILLGEMRDPETIALAISASETGHLVFGTLHTNNCVGSLNRIIDSFPPHQQSQIRTQLSFSLLGVLTQQLIPSLKGGRVLAVELMFPNAAIRSNIREDKLQSIYSSMQTGQEESGMITLNQSLLSLVKKRQITIETALELSYEKAELEDLINKMNMKMGSTYKR